MCRSAVFVSCYLLLVLSVAVITCSQSGKPIFTAWDQKESGGGSNVLEICFATPGSRLSHCAPVWRRMSEGERIASSRLPLSHFFPSHFVFTPIVFSSRRAFSRSIVSPGNSTKWAEEYNAAHAKRTARRRCQTYIWDVYKVCVRMGSLPFSSTKPPAQSHNLIDPNVIRGRCI